MEFTEFSAGAPDFGPLLDARAGKGTIPLGDGAKRAFGVIGFMGTEAVGTAGLCRTGARVIRSSVSANAAPKAKAAVAFRVKAPASGALHYRCRPVYGAGGGGGAKEPEVFGRLFSEEDNSSPFKAALWGVAGPSGPRNLLSSDSRGLLSQHGLCDKGCTAG